MKSEVRLVLEVWEAAGRELPPGKRQEAAIGIVRAFVDFGFDARDLAPLRDEEDELAEAYVTVFSDDEEEAEEGEDDYGTDEDE